MTVTRKPDHTKKTFKTIACGNAGCFGVSVVTNARAFYITRAAAGALAPGIPHALFGRKLNANLGCTAPREREVVSRNTPSIVVAREGGRSSIPETFLMEPRRRGVL